MVRPAVATPANSLPGLRNDRVVDYFVVPTRAHFAPHREHWQGCAKAILANALSVRARNAVSRTAHRRQVRSPPSGLHTTVFTESLTPF
ncbi:unnamed protein product [Leptosia nina]|uniref:Uncharacterized protein n=1 Tax=Leptosia nina TaxID=320188 RepID=A0AAV1IVT6_9NEOP